MGAEFFTNRVKGKTAESAFKKAVKEALYDYGHAGYTGTIAEKTEFKMVEVEIPKGQDPELFIEEAVFDGTAKGVIEDKWGPANCIKLGKDEWLFFGWASS